MNRSALLTAALIFGIQFGWSEFRKGETEYIVQVDEDVIAALRAGESFSSAIPPQLKNVTRVRLQFGTEPPGQPRMSYFGNREPSAAEREVLPAENGRESESGQAGQDGVFPPNYRGRELTQDSRNTRPSGAMAERIDSPPDYNSRGSQGNDSPPLLPPNQPGGLASGDAYRGGNSQDSSSVSGWNSREGGVYPGNDPQGTRIGSNDDRMRNDDRQVLPPGVSPVDIGSDVNRLNDGGGSRINPLDDPLAGRGSVADDVGVAPGPLPAHSRPNITPTLRSANPLLPPSRLTDDIPDSATGILLNGADGNDYPYRRSLDEQRALNAQRDAELYAERQRNANDPSRSRPGGFTPELGPQINAPADDRDGTRVADQNGLPSERDSQQASRAGGRDDDTTPVAGAGGDPSENSSNTTATKTPDTPWLMTFFLLCLSLGGNVYLTWIARGSYLRYRELSDQQRRASLDRIMLE